MKNSIKLFTILITISNFVNAQTMDIVLQKLAENGIIKQKKAPELATLLKRHDGNSNATYLKALYQYEYERLTGQKFSPFGNHVKFGFEKPKEKIQNKINKELSVYLTKLKNSGLVTDNQFEDQSDKINKNIYVHVLQLLPDLANQSAYEEWLSPEKIIKYGEELLANKVISENSFESLKKDVKAGKIQTHYQLVDYCNKALFFDLAKYSNDPSIYLEQIHKEVSTLLHELNFTIFKYKIEVDAAESFKDYTSYKAVVSVKANGKIYKQKSFISPNNIGKDGNYLGKIGTQEFYQIFNKILADNQSPLRLHKVDYTFQNSRGSGFQYFGIIVLSKEQLDMFRYTSSYIQVSYEKFKNTLTSARIDSAIKVYQQVGMLNHLTKKQIEEAEEKIKEQENKNLNDVLMAFPDVIHFFDTELGNLKDPYAELIQNLKKISHNDFNAIEISDNFDIEKKKEVEIKFKLGNKSYNETFKIEGDWIDTEFLNFIKSVVTKENLKGQFYELYTGGQEACIIYLTKEQYDYLKPNKLLVFGDEWQSEEE